MDDFESRMRQIEYEDALSAAQGYLDAGNHEMALQEARRAASMPGIVSNDSAHALIAKIKGAVEQAEIRRNEQAQREAQDRSRKAREASRKAASSTSKLLGFVGKIAFLASIALLALPTFKAGGIGNMLYAIDYQKAYLYLLILMAVYALTAYNLSPYPTGTFVLPIIWSGIVTFLLACASLMQINATSELVWGRWAKLLAIAAVVIVIASMLGSALRKARNK